MSFLDMPYPRNLPSFLHHNDVKDYIKNYAEKFKLYDHIRFGTTVDHVTPKNGGGWKVTTIGNGVKENVEMYDSILVCNGLVFSFRLLMHWNHSLSSFPRKVYTLIHYSQVKLRN